MKRLWFRTSFITLLLTLFAFVLTPIATVHAQKTIRVATVALPETTIYKGLLKWQELLNDRSGGKLKVKILGRGVMGGDREMIEACRLGTLDSAVVSGSVIANIVPQFAMIAMPYLFNSHEEANAFLDGKIGQKLFKLLEEKEIVGIGWATWSFRGIWNNVRPINGPEDLKGLKIRTVETPLDMAIITYMGGIPTPMAWSECLMGLRQGTVDGISTTYGLGYDLKLYEIAKYATKTMHYYESAPLIMSKKLFSTFTPEEQKIIKETGAEAMKWARLQQQEVDEKSKELLEAKGVKVNYLTEAAFNEFRERTKPIYVSFRNKIGPEFMDEALQFLEELRKSQK
ncbi:TRAP transporter substrate-binding protein [Thermodesulforhabdus norvegica]|uniref:Tripartite ATP-independent transporter solute receptor, DctP family n=1 Tax=Thermodesulforhabdus norvegica TaxID=39841 RepID=A0A1I4R4V3_9BACT|nr:TRAP transporter substrate-binding protein [Thermodesulforhabdus norvegica]SFM46960.1 tripartite ATP-independent transporter solute receptor, DctP family [Thermodesulforhabdus norvegica]